MSFTCQNCNKPQSAGTQPVKTVTKVRRKVYPQRTTPDGYEVIDQGGTGIETVEELNLCEKCAVKVGEPEMVSQKIVLRLGSLEHGSADTYHVPGPGRKSENSERNEQVNMSG